MKRTLRRLLAGILILLLAPALPAGAFAAPAKASAAMAAGALVSLRLREGEALEYSFSPTANGLYDVCLFPEGDNFRATVELFHDGEVIASGSGAPRAVSCRLNADDDYLLRVTGTGAGDLEIARQTLSRCFDLPLELKDGEGYSKLIARPGDVHWYAFTASRGGAAILAAIPDEKNLRLELRLFDAEGHPLAESDFLPSGAGAMSAALESGQRYLVRVAAEDGGVGKYHLVSQRSAVSQAPESVRLSESSLVIEGRSSASLRAENLPAGSCPLVLLDSSDPSVADARTNGLVAGRLPGETVVTAYAYGGAKAVCRATVEHVAVEGVYFAEDTLTLTVGDQANLQFTLTPENASNRRLTFVTENERVASVDRRGRLTAVSEGTARVVVISEDGGFSDVLFVVVEAAPRRYRALLIGEQNYASTVEQVRPGSIHSVESIQSLLSTASFGDGGFSTATLMDAPRDSVIAGIRETFSGAGEDDLSLIYITCHGFYKAGMSFFLMADGSVLSAADLERELRAIPGEVVLLADCCGSGGLIGEAGETDDLLDGIVSVFQGTVGSPGISGSRIRVVASALLDQDSYRISFSDGGEDGMATVFARALCDAAGWSIDRDARSAMNADADYDGQITLNELGVYMSRRVMWYLNLAGGYVQNVRIYPEGDGTVLFARSE